MAIAFDAVTNGGISNPVTSKTWSHTCSGSDRFLIVGTQAGASITGVTYNGVAMTLIDTQGLTKMWYLIAPATGSNSIVATAASSTYIMTGSVSYTGVNQSSPIDATVKGTDSGVAVDETLTTIADNCWTVMTTHHDGYAFFTPDAGTTTRVFTSGLGLTMVDSNAPKTPAGSTTLSGTSGSSSWESVMASFAPSVASVSNSGFLAFF